MQLIQNDVIQWDVKERFMHTAVVLSLGLADKFLLIISSDVLLRGSLS